MPDLAGRVVVVTGAAGQLGSAAVHRLHAAGARLALADRATDRLPQRYAELDGPDLLLVGGIDLVDAAAAETLAQRTADHFGHVDGLLNLVGGWQPGAPVHATAPADWDAIVDLNARSVFHACRAIAPLLVARGSGAIVNVASGAATHGSANGALYSLAKSAVVRLTESLAAELRPHRIHVNCVLPGTIDTPANRAAMPAADHSRWVPPDAIADVLCFLLSDAARAIRGAAIPLP